jgi:glycosyltransferase involved in cell wall biosynthesis
MRLLFVCTDMQRGGAERQWATLIPALRRRGAEVRLVCLNDEGPLFGELRSAGVPAVCLHLRGRADPRGLRRALAEARGRPGAVVTRAVSPQLVGQAIARRAGAAHVYNEHTPLTATGELLPARPHQRLLTGVVAPHVDRVIAVSQRQREPLTRLGYRAERIVTVLNGVFAADVETRAERADTRRALGLRPEDFTVACVANLRSEKGAQAFVEAVARARAEGAPGLRGVVVGDGPERARVERLAAEAGHVQVLGSRGDVPDLLAACDAFCLLSRAEALPMSILEAMALGLPVVTADVGGSAEAVADGETGIVVAPGDTGAAAGALAALATDPERARAMGERGRACQRERFGGEAMVDGYLRALEEVATR